MNTDLMNIIFGMKVRKARTEMGMSLTDFARQVKLSPSYLTEIEKGRKYPKRDKIMKIAESTGVDYDDLVSIRLDPSLSYLETALASPLLNEFPLDEFGIDLGALVDMLTRAPAQVSALLHALIAIGRRYDMKEEHFLRAALRSFQEMNDNHLPEIEQAAEEVAAKYGMTVPLTREQLEKIVCDEYNFVVDYETISADKDLANYRSIMINGRQPRLMLNSLLHAGQIDFLICREIGHKHLGFKERAFTSPPDVAESFEQVFNDFKASYFAGALMMPRDAIMVDIEALFEQTTWQPEHLHAMLDKYNATPEMLLYRMSELISTHFGIDLHFLRFDDRDDNFRLVKQLNMNELPLPSGFGLNEHYCRRWLTVDLIQQMDSAEKTPHANIQISEFLHSGDKFLCFGFARPLALTPGSATSVSVGFRVNSKLRHTIKFADDPNIPQTVINDTCERCSLTADQCKVRAVPATILEGRELKAQRKKAVRDLVARVRN